MQNPHSKYWKNCDPSIVFDVKSGSLVFKYRRERSPSFIISATIPDSNIAKIYQLSILHKYRTGNRQHHRTGEKCGHLETYKRGIK
jgi:hypothetical protein